MGWDRGRYYTRSRKVEGRVEREYIGTGKVAELVARLDALEREQREENRRGLQIERQRLAALDAPVAELCGLADLLAHAALLATGYHQHHRGDWRKQRGQRTGGDSGSPDQRAGTADTPQAGPEG